MERGVGIWDICAIIISVSFPSVVDLCTPTLAGAHLLFNITSNHIADFQKKYTYIFISGQMI
jgi:hypothetical protein